MVRLWGIACLPVLVGALPRPGAEPPTFVTGAVRGTIRKARPRDEQAAAAVRAAFQRLRAKLGERKPKCYLVTDNLGAAGTVCSVMKELAGSVPVAGLATNWGEYVPIDRRTLAGAVRRRHGINITAICGDANVQVEAVTGLVRKDVPAALPDDERRRRWEEQRPLHAAKGEELAGKFRFDRRAGVRHVLLVLGTMHTPRNELVLGGLNKALPAGVILVGGSGADFGAVYHGHKAHRDALLGVRISGAFHVAAVHAAGGRQLRERLPAMLKQAAADMLGRRPTGVLYLACAGWRRDLAFQQEALQQRVPERAGVFGLFCGGELARLADDKAFAGTDLALVLMLGPKSSPPAPPAPGGAGGPDQ